MRESIVSPNAYIEPGFPTGIMPSTFAQLPAPQIDALVKYLVDSQTKASRKK